jgi:hypothetical protein
MYVSEAAQQCRKRKKEYVRGIDAELARGRGCSAVLDANQGRLMWYVIKYQLTRNCSVLRIRQWARIRTLTVHGTRHSNLQKQYVLTSAHPRRATSRFHADRACLALRPLRELFGGQQPCPQQRPELCDVRGQLRRASAVIRLGWRAGCLGRPPPLVLAPRDALADLRGLRDPGAPWGPSR